MQIDLPQITALIGTAIWPLGRISGLVIVSPIFSAKVIPPRIRILIILLLTAVVVPLLPVGPAVSPFSFTGIVLVAQQIAIGAAMGFVLKLVFEAVAAGGQLITLSMGLSYADVVDPQQEGVMAPALSQFYMLLATLVFLSVDGHLMMISLLVDSFKTLPIKELSIDTNVLWILVSWGSQVFSGAVQVALPAMAAVLIVNIGFGVMSRAAPSLNLFAVGFPITISLGLVIVWLSLRGLPTVMIGLIESAFALIHQLLRAG